MFSRVSTRARLLFEGLTVLVAIVLLLRYWPGVRPDVGVDLEVIAHRGVHPIIDGRGVDRYTCTARVYRVEHPYIENTLPSIAAAFRAGATMVEIDIHDTSDGHIVVFHDSSVDCKTNGKGVTREQSLAYLKSLDVGYGYTADGGKTFPLRGTGIGAMPTLEEVLDDFPDGKFLLDHKSGRIETVRVLANELRRYPAERLRKLYYWGVRYDELKSLVPSLGGHFLAREGIKTCAIDHGMTLGLLDLPRSCAGKHVMLPEWALDYVWGFPDRFMESAIAAGTRVFVTEIDTIVDATTAIGLPIHGVMTDRIEVVGPHIRQTRMKP